MSWKTVALGDVCKVIAGQSPEGKYYNNDGVGLPFYQGKKDFGKVYINPPTVWTSEVTKEAIKDDILMSVRAPVGPVNISRENICIGRGLAAIRSSEKIDKAYLFNFLLSIEKELIGSSGAVFNSINKGQIEKLEIPLPPLATQRKIVTKLDAIFAEIDKAMASAEANAKNTEALFQSLLSEVLNENKQKNKELTLDDVCDLITCGVAKRPEYVDSGIPFLSAKNVKKQKIIWNDYQFVSFSTHSELTKHNKPLKGDILYTRVGSYGEAAIIDKDCDFSIFVSLTLIKPKTEIVTNQFLVYFLNSAQTKALASRSISGSGVGNLNVGTVRKFIINLPSIKEQGEIIKKLDSIKAICDSLTDSYKRKYQSLCLYKESILKQAFNGELVRE